MPGDGIMNNACNVALNCPHVFCQILRNRFMELQALIRNEVGGMRGRKDMQVSSICGPYLFSSSLSFSSLLSYPLVVTTVILVKNN